MLLGWVTYWNIYIHLMIKRKLIMLIRLIKNTIPSAPLEPTLLIGEIRPNLAENVTLAVPLVPML